MKIETMIPDNKKIVVTNLLRIDDLFYVEFYKRDSKFFFAVTSHNYIKMMKSTITVQDLVHELERTVSIENNYCTPCKINVRKNPFSNYLSIEFDFEE